MEEAKVSERKTQIRTPDPFQVEDVHGGLTLANAVNAEYKAAYKRTTATPYNDKFLIFKLIHEALDCKATISSDKQWPYIRHKLHA